MLIRGRARTTDAPGSSRLSVRGRTSYDDKYGAHGDLQNRAVRSLEDL